MAAVATDARDWITQDLIVQLAHEKEAHRLALEDYLVKLAESEARTS
jgi:hypothetical protein